MLAVATEPSLDQTVETLRFLSDKNRLRLLSALTRAETCVCDLIDELGIPQPLVSYHLGKLRSAGLVRSRREAQWIYYSLDPDAWEALLAPLAGLLNALPLQLSAAYGASNHCETLPANPSLGACPPDDPDCC